MSCGADDLVCLSLQWLSENGYIASTIAEYLANHWKDEGGIFGFVGNLLKDYGQLIVGILGVSFGVYRWWYYREKELHNRLFEYLNENDARLDNARCDLRNAIERPGPTSHSRLPLFADHRLVRIFRERRWDFARFGNVIVRSVKSDINDALDFTQRRIATSERTLASFQHQKASALLIKGAAFAFEADHCFDSNKQKTLNQNALTQFRLCRSVPGHERNLEALEYEAHQLRRLGQIEDALQAYCKLEEAASSIEIPRSRDRTTARARRYQAEAVQILKIEGPDGPGSLKAYRLMADSTPGQYYYPGALSLWNRHTCTSPWEEIEYADMLYLTAFTAYNLGYGDKEPDYLDAAADIYREISQCKGGQYRQLREAASRGETRVKNAKDKKKKSYEISWLLPNQPNFSPGTPTPPTQNLPPSNDPQQPAEPVGTTGGDQGIQEAPKQGRIDDPRKP